LLSGFFLQLSLQLLLPAVMGGGLQAEFGKDFLRLGTLFVSSSVARSCILTLLIARSNIRGPSQNAFGPCVKAVS
jgi:hypothetical protein